MFKDGANFAFELLGKGQDLADGQATSRMSESKQAHEHFVAAAGLHISVNAMPMLLQPPYIFASGHSGGYLIHGQSVPPVGKCCILLDISRVNIANTHLHRCNTLCILRQLIPLPDRNIFSRPQLMVILHLLIRNYRMIIILVEVKVCNTKSYQ
jgi:hypothetical protein